jgi:ELWxxDGT repeat protein
VVQVGGQRVGGLMVAGDHLYFHSNWVEYGSELAAIVGGSIDVTRISDIYPGANNSSFPSELIAFKGRLFFSADDGVHGEELWQTDGTTDGTVMTADIWASGNQGSDPGGFAEVGDYLVFNAWHGKRTLLRLKIHNTSTTGLENNLSEPTLFRIYPNPAHAVLYMEPCQETGFQYLVYDLKGREVMNGRLLDAGRVTLDISILPPGLYMLRARNTGSCQTVRFAVQ